MMVKGRIWFLSISKPGSDSCGDVRLTIFAFSYRVLLCQEFHPVSTARERLRARGTMEARAAWLDVHIEPMNSDGKATTLTRGLS